MNTLTIPYYKFWDIPVPTLKAGTKYAYVEALWCANNLQEIIVDSRIESNAKIRIIDYVGIIEACEFAHSR